MNTTEPYEIDESFKFKNYLVVQSSSQSNLQVTGSILFNSSYEDGYLLPSESYISIKVRIVKADGTLYDNEKVTLVNNAMFLFKDAKYAISDTEIGLVSHLGQATSSFSLITLHDDFSTSLGLSRCWSKDTTNGTYSYKYHRSRVVPAIAVPAIAEGFLTLADNLRYNQGFAVRKSFIFSSNPKGCFSFTISFSHIFGFSEYRKLLYGVQQTLTLDRGDDKLAIHHTDDNALVGKVELSNITWYIPKYELNTAASAKRAG